MDGYVSRTNKFASELIEKDLISSKKHNAIYDYFFQTTLRDAPWYDWLDKPGYFEVADEYKERITEWIHDNDFNTVTGLNQYKHCDLINGTTQAFDEAYYRYKDRNLRVLRGEYAYHKRIVTDYQYLDSVDKDNIELSQLDDKNPIKENDWVIMSLPFCGNGAMPTGYHAILDDCWRLKVPVLVDCAWYGTCMDLHIELGHPAITEVCFSLTKSTGTGNIRSGVRYSNYEDNLPIRQQNNYNHLVLGAAQVGIHVMKHIPSDWQVKNYRDFQVQLCRKLNIMPTNCMHIALAEGDEDWHKDFLIDQRYYKVGIRQALKEIKKGNL
jgi:hypothetical protein